MFAVNLEINHAGSLNEAYCSGLSNRSKNNERKNLGEVQANRLKLLYFFISV